MARPTGAAFNKLIGQAVSEARRLAHLTVPDLADRLVVDITRLKEYEAGLCSVPVERLVAIADLTGVSVLDLIPESTP
jgi:transcriptional regulator with XRE-family HTH domain